ncbi:MAG: putative glycolipid-binding domain-containing protein [Dongiaceae bacterium]
MTPVPARDRTVLWAPWQGAGLEHLRLRRVEEGYVADGLVIGLAGGVPFRLAYRIKADPAWATRKAELVCVTPSGEASRTLRSDGAGRWTGAVAMPELEGCRDVDISVTPFTNTLAIGRLGLAPGQAGDLRAAYVAVPSLAIRPVDQRYRCLERGPRGGRVVYEALFRGFSAELALDGDGLVLDYPEHFRRVHPRD